MQRDEAAVGVKAQYPQIDDPCRDDGFEGSSASYPGRSLGLQESEKVSCGHGKA